MERPAGSYILDEQGNLIPNPDDEAMAARHGLKKPKSDIRTGKEEVKKEKEVKANG